MFCLLNCSEDESDVPVTHRAVLPLVQGVLAAVLLKGIELLHLRGNSVFGGSFEITFPPRVRSRGVLVEEWRFQKTI